ncbi:hypothetical protein ASE16_02450 [Leifsonia sp. Root227]|uniref:DUF7882 family protein n=1 Tax=Leifsonia sp. Root227 TaxID=1736496 RepID=UPI0006FFF763|nr:hypothetical protein [Leifsonia sp. Root227]KRC51948.1 hypothetical protein ASE16_02450 [Leifsonia sp. Root227]
MGKLMYGTHGRPIDVEDRMLAHLEIAILSKLRRQEPFALSWISGGEDGEAAGRRTTWISPGMELEFVYSTSESPQINREWAEILMMSADRGTMHLRPEPDAESLDATKRALTKVN